MAKRKYITTAIDYPNAPPHMGHVLEKVLADVIARWFRLRGDSVRFQIGTDEHGIKIQQTAEKEGMTPKELLDRNVPLFQALYERLQISADVFVRTSDREGHWPTVRELWKRLQKAGMLERRTYTGLYCSGCERFLTKKDVEDGKCPTHKRAPTEVKEENDFFLLSKETEWLKELLKTTYAIVPAFREAETMALLEGGLDDVSFSRPKTSLAWGIPVPGDDAHVMYVWCDALTNYISGLGAFTDRDVMQEWWDDAEVTHVIGKDIARFHALIWPAMLKHAGLRTPNRLLIHGFLTSEGEKMSKSLGNVVVPEDVIAKYGVDALRFYLAHEIPVGNDGDFSWKRFQELYDSKLRNQLGNLLNRVLVLLQKEGGVLSKGKDGPQDYAAPWWELYSEAMDSFRLHLALDQVDRWLTYGNGYMDSAKPWALKGAEKSAPLWHVAESLRQIALMLLPFVPETAQKISFQLNVPFAKKMLEKDFVITEQMKQWGGCKDWKTVGEPEILFPPILSS